MRGVETVACRTTDSHGELRLTVVLTIIEFASNDMSENYSQLTTCHYRLPVAKFENVDFSVARTCSYMRGNTVCCNNGHHVVAEAYHEFT